MLLVFHPSACSVTTASRRSVASGISWYGAKRLNILMAVGPASMTFLTVLPCGLLPNRT